MKRHWRSETPLLEDFLYEAIFIPEGVALPPKSIIKNEDLQVYVRDFGLSHDDKCLVAEVDGKIVGAIWSRQPSRSGFARHPRGVGDRHRQRLADLLSPTVRMSRK